MIPPSVARAAADAVAWQMPHGVVRTAFSVFNRELVTIALTAGLKALMADESVRALVRQSAVEALWDEFTRFPSNNPNGTGRIAADAVLDALAGLVKDEDDEALPTGFVKCDLCNHPEPGGVVWHHPEFHL